MSVLNNIIHNLYGKPEELNTSHAAFFKFFELFVVIETIYHAWYWGLYTLKITDVILPLGIANYIDISFMHGNNLPVYVAILISLGSVAAFLRVGSKYMYAIVALLLHLQYVARFSIGEIPHSANLIGLSVVAFGIGNIFFQKAEDRYRFILGTIIFFTGLGYTTAAISKLVGTGITWMDGRHLWLWIAEKSTDILSREGAFSPNIVQNIALNSIPAATAILAFGFLSELLGFMLWFRKFRPYIVTMLIGLHIGITLSMNIRFDAFVIELILIGYPWPAIIERIKENTAKPSERLVQWI